MKLKAFPILTAIMVGLLSSCNNDDDMDPKYNPTGETTEFTLSSKAVPGISGTVVFAENDNNSTTITIRLNNTPAGGDHPAHIHFNTAAEGGDIALTLGSVDGDTGEGEITVTTLNDGSLITYDELIQYDGYINVHLSASDLGTIVAQGDIGINELTGESKVYDLSSVAVPDISGSVLFEERASGEALATITLENTPEGGSHPAHIHFNTAAEGGGIALSFNPIDGSSGVSKTNISALNDGSAFGYTEILDYDGYINVHLSSENLATIVAQGDIGQNELTGGSTTYTLVSKAVPGIDGEAVFYERSNGEALAILTITNTPEDGMHPAHIHYNSAAEGGGIAFSFSPVDGNTGISKTNVSALNDQSAFLYSDVIQFDGYINVHLSQEDLATIVAQGDIGPNAL